jgi:pimeloyl-ACP methyl ester carboxylesterase
MRRLVGFLKRKLVRLGLGAGMLGALVLAFRFAKTPRSKLSIPQTISPAIFATRVLYTSPGQIVYHESGQGEPLIFVHGVYLGASSYEWSKVYPHFADRFQVIALDLLGFGESERSVRNMSVEDHVRALAEFLRAKCGDTRAVVVASGLGATFASIVAQKHPELVQRLVLAMPVADKNVLSRYLPPRLRWLTRVALRNVGFYRRYFASKAQVREWLVSFGFGDPERIDPEIIDVLANRAQQYGAQRAALHWLRYRKNLPLAESLAAVIQPVTLLWGEKAVYPGIEEGHRLQSILQHGSFVILEGCGILAALEEPAQLVELLDRELNPGLRVFRV